jgi:hypothetical protein
MFMRLLTLCVAMASWSAIGQQCTVSNNTFISVTNCTGDVCSVSPLEMSQLPHLPAFTEQLISGAAGRCNGTVVFGQPLSIRYSDISYTGSLEVRRATELFVSWVNTRRGGLTVGGQQLMVRYHVVGDGSNPTQVTNATYHASETVESAHFLLGPYGSTLV